MDNTHTAGLPSRPLVEENHAIRLRQVTGIVRDVGPAATPWLVDQIAGWERWDWNQGWGGVDKRIYLLSLLRLLDRRQAAAFADRLRAVVPDDGVLRMAVARLLGDPLPAGLTPPDDVASYAIDAYGDAVLEEIVETLEEEQENLPRTLHRISLRGHPGQIQLHVLALAGPDGRTGEVFFATPESPIPLHCDWTDEDAVRRAFLPGQGLDENETLLQWSDTTELPWVVLTREYWGVLHRLLPRLAGMGFELAPDVRLEIDDDAYPAGQLPAGDAWLAEALSLYPSPLREAIAALLYARPERRRSALGL